MLNLPQLIDDLGAAYDATLQPVADAATAKENFVSAIANAIDTYVRGAEIVYSAGLFTSTGSTVEGDFIGGLD